jgi:hypothetical protein
MFILVKKNKKNVSVYGSTVLLLDLGRFFSFLISLDLRSAHRKAGTYTQNNYKHRINAHTDIHALSGIRTHDPSVRAGEDSSCLSPRDHCDRQKKCIYGLIICFILRTVPLDCICFVYSFSDY